MMDKVIDTVLLVIGVVLVSQIIINALETLTGVDATLAERCISSVQLSATFTWIALKGKKYRRR